MTPEELKNVPPEGGKIRISDRERWYYASIRACLKLERWEQALELARKASEEFPGRIDFSRWNAQALAGLGQPGEALLEMEELLKKCRSEWYVLADYAELKAQLGERQEALRKACSAALMPGEKKAKVNLYLLLAKLFLADGREEQARIHVALTVGTRKEEGWSLPEELTRLAQRLGVSLDSGGQEGERLYGICRECWQREASEGKQWRKGVVINIPEGAHFAFIKCEDFEENIFVLQRDLPPAACRKGARVRFIEEASFDKKKNRESFRAIEVQAGE
jgi:tetratricopeptide (TPR) repeat protein